MIGAISVLAGVGIICASGIAISSGIKFFYTYEFDLAALLKESKKTEVKKAIGGDEHDKRIEGLSAKRHRP